MGAVAYDEPGIWRLERKALICPVNSDTAGFREQTVKGK